MAFFMPAHVLIFDFFTMRLYGRFVELSLCSAVCHCLELSWLCLTAGLSAIRFVTPAFEPHRGSKVSGVAWRRHTAE